MKLFKISILAISALLAAGVAAKAEDNDPEALAKAMKGVTITLDQGIKASEPQGTPISGKFELDGDALQLSVYTINGAYLMEVVVDYKTGKVVKSEKITDPDDLKDANAQSAAVANAKVTLDKAVQDAVKANNGYVAVSVLPAPGPVANITLMKDMDTKKVTRKLD